MHARLQLALWSAAAVFGLAYGKSEAAPNAYSHGQVLSELRQAKHLLDHANHDYNGHRAKADHDITKAIRLLHHQHHKKSTTSAKAAPPKGTHKAMHEPQQASDTQLRQAEKLVHAAMHELHKHHGDKAHHASKLLHQATHEIELAIHLHHKHHAKNQLVPAK
jgi:hypothetical protein